MIAQLSTVKARIPIDASDTTDDDLLTRLIKFFGGRAERECNRIFDRLENAKFEFRGDEMNVYLDRYPVEAVTKWEVKSTEQGDWAEVTAPDYVINPRKHILELASPLATSRDVSRVTFDGGYVLPGDVVQQGSWALPDELEQACIEQVTYWHQNKNRLGIQAVNGEGGSVSMQPVSIVKPLDLLPQVKAVLSKYERWVL